MLATCLGLIAVGPMGNSTDLDAIASDAVRTSVAHFAREAIKDDEIGICLARVDRGGSRLTQGGYRSSSAMYPASVIKIFYLVNLANRLDEGSLTITPELNRAAHDMIVDSVNDATSLVVDVLTGTTSGPELPEDEMRAWVEKRNSVNRWYKSLGYEDINACQKTWNEGPYGRDHAFYGPNFENRNRLTPDACVKLMGQIALDRAVPYGREADKRWMDWIKGFLKRDLPEDGKGNEQALKFSGASLPKGSDLWSKAGWTDSVRHDLAWFKLPDGREFIWAIFTKNHSNQEGLIPFLAKELLKGLG